MSIIGGHVSIAGGLHKSVERAVAEDFNALQIFVSSPRTFKPNNYTEEDIQKFLTAYTNAQMKALFFHAIYLVNLGSENENLDVLSVNSLKNYLQVGAILGSSGTIVHIGSGSIEKICDSLSHILSDTPTSQKILVENMASEKRIVFKIEQCVEILEKVQSDRIQFCIDTQHLFASGVDICNSEVATSWLDDVERLIGIDKIACIHVNDSKTPCGSQHDRHENIGEGEIGLEGIKTFLSDQRLAHIPLILEVPGFAGNGPDKKNKLILESMLSTTGLV
ncbi:MAG: putative endonuclease 4 [Microgenomates bacterium OLB23]|nr:MAG: putative endonuclease 4 [Microgenomates bacterium OLB23]